MRLRALFLFIAGMGWPWHPSAPGCPQGTKMRHHARMSRFKRFGPVQQFALKVITAILWPLGAYLELRRVGRIHRAWIKDGKPVPEGYKAMAAYWAALRHNIPPFQYQLYELWRKERIADRDAYVYLREHTGLMHALNHVSYRPEDDPIQDKIAFADFCDKNGLPYPASLWSSASDQRPDLSGMGDLWVKPSRGNGGRHQKCWKYNKDGSYECGDKTLSLSELIDHLGTLSASVGCTFILQPRLRNHVAFDDLSNGALVVIRFVSGKHKNGTIVPIAATISFPAGKAVTSHSGLLGTLDLKTGQVTHVRTCSVWHEAAETHPDTGAAFASTQIPEWAGICDVIERAHLALDGYVAIGWDIAVTPDGPVLLEGNSGWNSQQHQESCPMPQPLGRSALAQIACSYWA